MRKFAVTTFAILYSIMAVTLSAQHSLSLSTNRYKGGVATYLEVITAQSTALSDQRVAVEIAGRRMTASVSLIKALGGGWNAADLPMVQKDTHRTASSGQ